MLHVAPAGTEHTRLEQEARTLFHYIKGGNDKLKQIKCEAMFVQLLEGLHESEAEMLIPSLHMHRTVVFHSIFSSQRRSAVSEAKTNKTKASFKTIVFYNVPDLERICTE